MNRIKQAATMGLSPGEDKTFFFKYLQLEVQLQYGDFVNSQLGASSLNLSEQFQRSNQQPKTFQYIDANSITLE